MTADRLIEYSQESSTESSPEHSIWGFTVTHNAIRVREVPVNDVTFVDCCQVLDTSLQRSPDYQKVR